MAGSSPLVLGFAGTFLALASEVDPVRAQGARERGHRGAGATVQGQLGQLRREETDRFRRVRPTVGSRC